MHCYKTFLLLAIASIAKAAKLSNSDFSSISAGSPFTITWLDASGPVTLKLKKGPATALQDVTTIGTGLTGTSFSWTPSGSFSDGPFAIEITDSTGPNYSVQFAVAGGSNSAVVSSGTLATSASSALVSSVISSIISSASSAPTSTLSLGSAQTSAFSALSSNPSSQSELATSGSSLRISAASGTRIVASQPSGTRISSANVSSTNTMNAAPGNGVNGFNLLALIFGAIGVAGAA